MTKKSVSTLASLVCALALTPAAQAAWTLNMTPGITAMSKKIYDLHMIVFWVCVIIAVFVFGWMIVSLVRYRKSKGAVPDTKMLHNTKAEVIWTAIPVLILIGMAVPAARVLIEEEDAKDTTLSLRITGYQWKWGYEYLGKNVSFFSTLDEQSNFARQLESGVDVNGVENYLLNVDHPLVVPAGVRVHVLLTAQDVIHAWWVPALAIKKDAIPGTVNDAWFEIPAGTTGLYRGQCAELCGRDHGFMPIVIDVRSQEDFDAWVKAQQPGATATAAAAPAAGSPAT